MDGVQEITQVISSVGFPIVACGALFWMINTTMKDLRDALTQLTKSIDQTNKLTEEAQNG
jgi:RNA-splicing ligase RtcB